MPSARSVQHPNITFEESGNVRKRGHEYRLRREMEAMEYVRGNTSIPIPRVLESYLDPATGGASQSWILMEKLSGTQMGTAWPSMSEQAQSNTLAQLRSYFQQLHRLQPLGVGWIGSCSHGPAYDHRINNMTTCGPFSSVSEFHDFLVAPVKKCPKPEWAEKYRSLLSDTYSIRFAHADVSWENILIEPETGAVTGILDWEMAGFWPEWWEYRKALFGARGELWWVKVLNDVMQQYSSETEIDMELEMY